MNRLALAVASLACCGPLLAATATTQPTPTPGMALTSGDAAPFLHVTAMDGHETDVAWAAGKLTLVNFWATWCAPCRQEMPQLQAIYEKHKRDGLQLVGVVVLDRGSGNDIISVANDTKVHYPLYWGGPSVELAWRGISILPTTYLVDPAGKIVRKYVGTSPDELAAVTKDVADFLAGRPLGDPYVPPPDAPPAPAAMKP